jgi:site-specific DNA recombinase
VTVLRFAHYGRLSTTDKQDPSLSFPSQKKACDRKADDLSGEITCEFADQESGAKADRPGWGRLMAEASNRETRRFDAVVIYNTARLSRDRVHAALFERELRQVGVAIHYATGGGDPTTAEGRMMIGLQQIFDQFERDKLARETKRGMREATEQGLRVGGRAPYGYRRAAEAMPEGHLGDRTKQRVRLEPDPNQAPVVVEIFHMHAERGLSPKAIADHLNRRGGPPSPRHVDTKRNVRGHWAATTIRSMLNNPVYTGRMVWNRLDFATARETGRGAPRLRAREEWVVCQQAHVPLVSDELFGASQERFQQRPRRQASSPRGARTCSRAWSTARPVTSRCQCRARPARNHHYYACSYGATYGDVAACETHAGQKWIYLREDALLPLVHQFFAQRIFGPMRLEKLAKQLRAAERESTKASRHLATRLRQQIADTERRIKLQVQALEDGIEPEIVGARIKELRTDRDAAQADLDALGPEEVANDQADIAARLARLPDLGRQLRRHHQQFSARHLRPSDYGSPTTSRPAASRSAPRSPKP